MMSERETKAIENLESIISVMINDMSIGASYVRTNASSCLDMINLVDKIQARIPKDKKKK